MTGDDDVVDETAGENLRRGNAELAELRRRIRAGDERARNRYEAVRAGRVRP
jgi:hypothetical protein